MRRHFPLDLDDAVTRLAQRVETLHHDLAELGEDLTQVRGTTASHGRALTHLGELFATGTARPATEPGQGDTDEPLPPAPDWAGVTDPGLAVAWLNGLAVWVPRIWLLYPGSRLTPCWPWHPAIVSELLVSQHLWLKAVTSGPAPEPLAGWHDRWRPAAAVRITRSLSGCERGAGCHVNPAGHHFTYDLDHLDDLAVWWATHDRPDLDAAPGLTREREHPRYTRDTRT